MANHVSHAALPYPIKGARYTVEIPYLDADGDPTDPTTPDTEISEDGGAFTDCAEEVTTVTGSNGLGYLTLSGAETDNSMFALAAKVASGPKATLGTFYPRQLVSIGTGTLSAGSSGGGTLGTVLAYDLSGCFIKTTGGTGGGGTGGANNQARKIMTYDVSTGAFTVEPNWETTPSTDTTYAILLPEGVTLGMLKTLNPTTPGRTLTVESDGMAHADVKEWTGSTTPVTNLNVVFNTDFATNYDATNDVWVTRLAASGLQTDAVEEIRNAITGGAYDLDTDANGRIRIVDGTGAGELDTDSGTVLLRAATEAKIDAILDDTGTSGVALANNSITASVIADGAIDRATFAADTGLQTIRSGTAQTGTANTITLDVGASSTGDFYKGCLIYLTGGTGAGQFNICTTYSGGVTKIATVHANWLVTPDNTTTFALSHFSMSDVHTMNSVTLSTTIAQIGVNVVNAAGTAWNSGSITASTIATDAIDADALATTAVNEIADQVWEEAIADHSGTVGSTAEALAAAGSAGDPWTTALPGAYGAGSAGFILGTNLNATVSSRSSHSAADVWAVGARTLTAATNITSTGGTITVSGGAVTVGTNNDKTGYTLSQAGLAAFFTTDSGETYASSIAGSVVQEIADNTAAAGDPWATVLPGAYVGSEAGKILADILVDTGTTLQAEVDDIQTRLPAALVGGRMDSSMSALDNDATLVDKWAKLLDGMIEHIVDDTDVPPSTTSFEVFDAGGAGRADKWLDTVIVISEATDSENLGYPVLIDDAQENNNGKTLLILKRAIPVALTAGDKVIRVAAWGPGVSYEDIADQVWEEALADHSGTVGSTAEALDAAAAGGAADPWATALPGAYVAGQAGYILGTNLDATISSRPTAAAIDTVLTAAHGAGAWTTGGGGTVGPGAISTTLVIKLDTGVVISNCEVWITTDLAGSIVIAGTLTTDSFGKVTFMLDPGTYYAWRQKPGVNFDNPETFTVT